MSRISRLRPWSHEKKRDVSTSLQDLHCIDAEFRGSLPKQGSSKTSHASKINKQYSKMSLSVQNMNSVGKVSPPSNPKVSSRLSNIRNLSLLLSHSTPEIWDDGDNNNDVGRPVKDHNSKKLQMGLGESGKGKDFVRSIPRL